MLNKVTAFGWVWAVCFLASWCLVALVNGSEGWYLGLIAIGVSLPIAAAITGILFIFRSSIAGTDYEKRLEKVKGMRIMTVSGVLAFVGAAEIAVFGSGIGEVVVYLSSIGGLAGMIIHFYEMVGNHNA